MVQANESRFSWLVKLIDRWFPRLVLLVAVCFFGMVAIGLLGSWWRLLPRRTVIVFPVAVKWTCRTEYAIPDSYPDEYLGLTRGEGQGMVRCVYPELRWNRSVRYRLVLEWTYQRVGGRETYRAQKVQRLTAPTHQLRFTSTERHRLQLNVHGQVLTVDGHF